MLNVGLDMGILSPTLFAMLVLLALVTTFSTTPALHWLMGGPGLFDREAESAVHRGEPLAVPTVE